MWYFKDAEFKSEDIGDAVGFVYLITHIASGRKYIGKRGFYSTITKPLLKNQKRRRKITTENKWDECTGSNDELNTIISQEGLQSVRKEILHLCKSKGVMSFLELKEQVERNVLLDDLYFNQFIGCRIHAKHLRKIEIS